MKFIDEKGKLFGKVNVIDLFVLLVIILIAAAAVYKFAGKEVGIVPNNAKQVTFTVRCTLKNESIAKNIKVGEELIASNQRTGAYIESVEIQPTVLTGFDNNGNAVSTNDPIRKDALIKVKMTDSTNGLTTRIGVQDVLTNNSFTLKTESSVYVGTIESVQIVPPTPN